MTTCVIAFIFLWPDRGQLPDTQIQFGNRQEWLVPWKEEGTRSAVHLICCPVNKEANRLFIQETHTRIRTRWRREGEKKDGTTCSFSIISNSSVTWCSLERNAWKRRRESASSHRYRMSFWKRNLWSGKIFTFWLELVGTNGLVSLDGESRMSRMLCPMDSGRLKQTETRSFLNTPSVPNTHHMLRVR